MRVSLRFGTSTAVTGPAVEPNVHPTIGAGVRIGRRFGVLAEVDRAKSFHALARRAVRELVTHEETVTGASVADGHAQGRINADSR